MGMVCCSCPPTEITISPSFAPAPPGLHILAQAQFARHVVELGLVHQNPAGLGEDGLYRVLLAQQHVDRREGLSGVDVCEV